MKVGHWLHTARGFRDGLCNQEVLFLAAASLKVAHVVQTDTPYVHQQMYE